MTDRRRCGNAGPADLGHLATRDAHIPTSASSSITGPVNRGHLTSVICGHFTSVLTMLTSQGLFASRKSAENESTISLTPFLTAFSWSPGSNTPSIESLHILAVGA